MVAIKIKQGLDISIMGAPRGNIRELVANGMPIFPNQLSLNLDYFEDIKFKLLVSNGDEVKIGQPLVEDKSTPGRFFVSPAAGVVNEIRRAAKRRLTDIIIDVADKEDDYEPLPIDINNSSRELILEKLKQGGLFAHIRKRPFNLLADPTQTPRAIFIKALESAPFSVPAEMQMMGFEKEFQIGLETLKKLTDGDVHLVYKQNTAEKAFLEAKNVLHHTVEGPHPSANASVHIHSISPILKADEIIWTVNVLDVVAIGFFVNSGKYFTRRIISIAGPSVIPDQTGYFRARAGFPVKDLIAGRVEQGLLRYISGDPLTGKKVLSEDFLGFYDTVFSVLEENGEREFLHFFRLGTDKFTASRAYLTGFLDPSKREYDFTTNQHGEHRAFVVSSPYDKVMPMKINTMLLVKALMSEDYDLAESLGLLEVDSEDFALPTFVCPSKIEMTEIVKNGLKQYGKEVLL